MRLKDGGTLAMPEASRLQAYALITIVWVAMVALANPWGDFPIIDDWVYAQAVQSVLKNGYYYFSTPASANVGPQIYWGALFCLPFGFSYDALRVSTLVLGWGGGLFMYRLIRQLDGGHAVALVGALTLVVNPMYFGLATSFMTDVPFVAVSVFAAFHLIRNLQTDSRADLAIGIVATLTAIMVRQLGLALFAGYAVAYVWKHGARGPNLLKMLALLASGGLLHAGYQYWMIHSGRVPVFAAHTDPRNFLPTDGFGWMVRGAAVEMFCYAGLLIFPVAALFLMRASPAQRVSVRRQLVIGVLALGSLLLAAALFLRGRSLPSLQEGSVLKPDGFGPLLLRDILALQINLPQLPWAVQAFWALLTLASVAAIVLWLHRVGRASLALKPGATPAAGVSQAAVLMFCLATAGAYALVVLYAAGRFAIFDRYFMFLAPFLIAAMVVAEPAPLPAFTRRRLAGSGLAVAVMALASVLATHDFAAATRVRWQALDQLVQVDRIDPHRIDGGMEFNGSLMFRTDYVDNGKKSWWWVDDDEYVVATGPIPGYIEIRRYDFRRWFLQRDASIVVLRRTAAP